MLPQQEFLVPLTRCRLQTADNTQFGRRILHRKGDKGARAALILSRWLARSKRSAVLPEKVPAMERLAEETGIPI
jgi:hypothetical protein